MVDEARAQEHIEGESLDNSKPHANTEVTDPYEYRDDTVDVHHELVGVCKLG